MAIAVLFAVITGGGLYAQAIPGGFVSPQSSATQGRLRSAADDFIRPDSYAGVAFNNWYGMISYATTTTATLGFATKIGGKKAEGEETGEKKPVYLGVFYNGSFWANLQTFTSTERESPWLNTTKRVPVYANFPDFNTSNPSNQLAVLVGVADMGFRLSFRSTHKFFKEGNFIVGNILDNGTIPTPLYYKSHEMERGLLSPQIAWSMSKNLISNGIKPWATFDLGFYRDLSKSLQYAQSGGNWATGVITLNSQNYIAPELNIGMGGYTFANKDGWRFSTDIEYRLQIRAYDNNEYPYTADGASKTKTFKGTYDGTNIVERSFNGHRIRPSISAQWNGDKLRLRGKFDLNFIFDNTEANPMAVRRDSSNVALSSGELGYAGNTAKIFNFQFNPDLSLAAQWQVLPRLSLNIGGRVNINALSATTTEGKRYSNGEAVANTSYKTTAVSYGATQNQLSLGVTVNALDNLGIEANTGVSNASSNNVNIFNTTENGLFVFGSILVALKF
jgi:hypothetical protein